MTTTKGICQYVKQFECNKTYEDDAPIGSVTMDEIAELFSQFSAKDGRKYIDVNRKSKSHFNFKNHKII